MAETTKMPNQGSSNFHVSTKVYYQPRNDPTLPEAEGNLLLSATDRSLVPLGEFDDLPIAETKSPTQLFCFESRRETDVFNEVGNEEIQIKPGKNKGAHRVSFNSGDLIDSDDVLRLECLQGGAFKMFIPSSPKLERPPLCFEIKPPANVILDLPKCDKKPNIKVVVTTICSTGDPNETSNYKTEGGMDVETSNLDDPEIEELIRELCQVIVETHRKEESSPPRKRVNEPPQVVELYKRKIMPREGNGSNEYITYSNSESMTGDPFTFEHGDSGYFYFQPQSEPRGSSVSLFIDKICSCLGRTFGMISSDSNVRRQAAMKMEVDNDPEEGYVRCLLMGKAMNEDDDDCTCDQQPVAEIRNSAELMDKQSPLVDRIMYLLRKSVSHKYSDEKLMEDGGNGDISKKGNGYNGDGSAAGSAEKVDDQVVSKDVDKDSHRKSSVAKHHTRFRTENEEEVADNVEEEDDDYKKKKTSKKKARKLLCCTHGEGDKDKLTSFDDSEYRQNVSKSIGDEEVDKIPGDNQRRKEKRKKGAEKTKIEDMGNAVDEKVMQSTLDDLEKHQIHRVSSSIEEIDPCEDNCKMAKKMKKPKKMELDSTTNIGADTIMPSNAEGSKKRSSFQRKSGKSDVDKADDGRKKVKNQKKTPKGSEDESASSKKSLKTAKKKKEREEPRERSNDSERIKMIGHRDKAYWASYRRLRRRQMDKPESQFKESVISANISIDQLKMSSDSSSGSDSLIVDIESDIAMHNSKKKTLTKRISELSGKRRSYGKLRNYATSARDNSSDSSLDSACAKSSKVETRQRRDEVCKKSQKSKFDSKLIKEVPSGASYTELPSQNVRVSRSRQAFKDVLEKFKTLRTSTSSSKTVCEDEGLKPPHKKSHTIIHRRKKKEDLGVEMFISGSPKEQDDKSNPRNISAVMEAQALINKDEKFQLKTNDKLAKETDSKTNSSSVDISRTENDSSINLVIPCGSFPSEDADFIGLSSWMNPITKSTTAIDSKCDTLCSNCMRSISPSPANNQTYEISSPTTSITSRKSILVDRHQPTSLPSCSASVYSMCEVSPSGFPLGTILPAVASLDSKLRHREQLEKLTHLNSPTDFISLCPENDSSNQTLDSSSSAVTNNSSSVEVETKSTNFDSGTSVVSNVTIDSTRSQNPFTASVESEDAASPSNTALKARELSSTTVDTWSSTSSSSDIQRNQSSTSYQETTSANDSAGGLSSDGSRSLINSMIESLPLDSKCDDGSRSLFGESSGDSRSSVALSVTSTIDSGLSMGSQATSESIRTQDSLISRDIAISSGVSIAPRDSYQNDMRSQPFFTASETGNQASNTEKLNGGDTQHSIFPEMSNSCLSQSPIFPKLLRTSKANSTTSVSGCNASQLEGTSQRSISFSSEKPTVTKIQSADTVLAGASKTNALIVSPSKESSSESINRAKQICYQVPDIGPTFTTAMISSSASSPGANDSTPRSDSDQGSSVESVMGTESVVVEEVMPEKIEFQKLSKVDEHGSCCSMLPVASDEILLRNESNGNVSEKNVEMQNEHPSSETKCKDTVNIEKTTVEELVENVDNSNEVQPNKKKISRRKHIMATFLCISKPCQSARQSDSFAPYRPAQNTSGLDGPRNLSDTIPQIDRHQISQTHRSRRLFSDHHSKPKKTVGQETIPKDNTHRTGSDEVKLKSILSKTLHKDNRYKLTKKVSFSPNPSFIEAPTTPEGSTSRSQSEHETDVQAVAALSKLRAFGLRSPSCDSIVPLTASSEDFRNPKTSLNSQASLNRTRESFSGEENRDLRLRNERLLEKSQDQSDDSDTCSSREDEDDSNFEIKSCKSQESFRARLQLSNLMCESIPPKSPEVDLKCLEDFKEGVDADRCGLMLIDGSEQSIWDIDERDRKKNEDIIRDCEERYSRNMSSPAVKDSAICLVNNQTDKFKLFSKSKSREIDFLKDCPIENEDAKLEKQNSVRKMLKKRQDFVQKVSSLIKVTPLEDYAENLPISKRDQVDDEERKSKKSRGNTSKKLHRDEDRSPGQRGAPKVKTENDRQRKSSR